MSRMGFSSSLVSTLIFLMLIVTSCSLKPREMDLSFETIELKESPGTGKPYEAHEPGLMVVSRTEELELLNGFITDEAQEKLLVLDYGDYFALAAFQGWKPSSGYSIQVNRISTVGNIVKVYAQLHEPKPEEAKADMETSPYHLVIVKKVGRLEGETRFNLIIDKTVVDSISYTFP